MTLQYLIPMAGAGSRFQTEGYKVPKPMIELEGKAMVVRAIESLPRAQDSRYIFVCRSEHLKDGLDKMLTAAFEGATIIEVDHLTEGQACTCLLAREHLDPNLPLIIGACDNGATYNSEAFSQLSERFDSLVFSFRNNPTVVHKPSQYGWAATKPDGVSIERMSVKKAISEDPLHDHAVVGTFWFKQAQLFLDAADRMIAENRRINNEFYVDELFNDVIALGRSAGVFEIDQYICWGTPDDLRTWEYWRDHFRLLATEFSLPGISP